ncbi:MAG: hypothetical protein K0S64_107 [Gaiellaceae bacterium]|nr:hypothetical protein [Gaiellaceae bacterium]
MDPDLVDEPRGEELPIDVGAHEPDPLVGGGFPCQRKRVLDPVGHDGEDRIRRRERPVRDDEARNLAERALALHASIELS